MKVRVLLLAVSCVLSAVHGQWLETTIFTGYRISAMCYNAQDDKLYCVADQSDAGMLVIDGATNAIVDTVLSPQPGYSLCYNPFENEVYWLTFDDSHNVPCILAVDCSTHSVLDTMWGGDTLESRLCLNRTSNKLYASLCGYAGGVFVFDCSTHELLSLIPGGWLSGTRLVCHNPDDNKVYASYWSGTGNGMEIIDGERDSAICTIRGADDDWSGCHNSRHGKVYLGRPDNVLVVDGAGDSVRCSIGVPGGAKFVCYDPIDDKLYCGGGGNAVTAIDCSSDTVLTTIDLGRPVSALLYDSSHNRVYCASGDSNDVTVIDCSGETEPVVIGVMGGPSAFCHNPQHNRVYVLNREDGTISVIRSDLTAVKEEAMRRTAVRHGLLVRDAIDLEVQVPGVLLDISGRRVMDLQPGFNDVRHVAPGIYFVAEPGTATQGLRTSTKVIIQR